MKTSPPELGTPYLPDLNSETSSEEESSEEEAVQNISGMSSFLISYSSNKINLFYPN